MSQCLICKSLKVTKEFEFPISITSFSTLIKSPVEVYLCENCGHIFSPPNQLPDSFYESEYELLLEDNESEFVVFNEEKESTLFDKVLQFIFSKIKLVESNIFQVLEVGAGKGLLLKRLKEYVTKPFLLSAVEPNQRSEPFLKHNLSGHAISMTTLENSPFKDKIFNLIISHGVLEHVPDPITFLKSICACMDSKSILYIGVPNFETNPADLVTTDHLSKFTPQTIEFLFNVSGLKILSSNVNSYEVFMTYLVKKDEKKIEPYNHLSKNTKSSKETLIASLDYIKRSLKGFESAVEESIQKGKDLSIYGAGNIGLLAIKYFNLNEKNIKCIYDDNQTFWGKSRIGIPIKNPQELSLCKESILYISANACYHKNIIQKISDLTDHQATVYPKC